MQAPARALSARTLPQNCRNVPNCKPSDGAEHRFTPKFEIKSEDPQGPLLHPGYNHDAPNPNFRLSDSTDPGYFGPKTPRSQTDS